MIGVIVVVVYLMTRKVTMTTTRMMKTIKTMII